MSQQDYFLIRYELKKRGKNISWIAKTLDLSITYVIDLLTGKRGSEDKKSEIKELLEMEGIDWNY